MSISSVCLCVTLASSPERFSYKVFSLKGWTPSVLVFLSLLNSKQTGTLSSPALYRAQSPPASSVSPPVLCTGGWVSPLAPEKLRCKITPVSTLEKQCCDVMKTQRENERHLPTSALSEVTLWKAIIWMRELLNHMFISEAPRVSLLVQFP